LFQDRYGGISGWRYGSQAENVCAETVTDRLSAAVPLWRICVTEPEIDTAPTGFPWWTRIAAPTHKTPGVRSLLSTA
jgi:hypothetical protein